VLRRRRERELTAARRVDTELLAATDVDGRDLSVAALARLQELVGRTLHAMPVRAARHTHVDGPIVCTVERVPATKTAVWSPEGRLTFHDLRIRLGPADGG
jgi:hypothetical protein